MFFEDVDNNTTYTISTNNLDYVEDVQLVDTGGEKRIELDVVLKKLDDMIVYENGVRKLKNDVIYFDFDRSDINQMAAEELDQLVQVWAQYPSMVIKIESHTDSRGSSAYNQYLSENRAKSTKEYLVSKGISPSLIQSATGYGEARPSNQCKDGVNCKEDNHRSNRRSEFIIVKL